MPLVDFFVPLAEFEKEMLDSFFDVSLFSFRERTMKLRLLNVNFNTLLLQ